MRVVDGTRIALGVLRGPDGVVWIERGKPPSLGRWALPGGRIEPGEQPGDAARREVLEETELAVGDGLLDRSFQAIADAVHRHRLLRLAEEDLRQWRYAGRGGQARRNIPKDPRN